MFSSKKMLIVVACLFIGKGGFLMTAPYPSDSWTTLSVKRSVQPGEYVKQLEGQNAFAALRCCGTLEVEYSLRNGDGVTGKYDPKTRELIVLMIQAKRGDSVKTEMLEQAQGRFVKFDGVWFAYWLDTETSQHVFMRAPESLNSSNEG